MHYPRNVTILMLALTLAACGHGGAPSDTPDAAASQAPAQPPAQAPAAAAAPAPETEAKATRPLEVADLDAYARGMQKEIEMRQAASDRAAKAKAANDKTAELNGLFELTSVEVTRAGAKAAGVDPARYDFIKNTVDRVLGQIDMNAMMAAMGDSPQARKLQSDPYAGLSPTIADALKAREDELGKLRKQNMAILAKAQNL